MGKGSKFPKKQRAKVTDAFQIIRYEDVPVNRRNKITYTKIVCKYRANKGDPNGTRITIGKPDLLPRGRSHTNRLARTC